MLFDTKDLFIIIKHLDIHSSEFRIYFTFIMLTYSVFIIKCKLYYVITILCIKSKEKNLESLILAIHEIFNRSYRQNIWNAVSEVV